MSAGGASLRLDPQRPWLGLRSYTSENQSYFYGRDGEVRELYRRVCLDPMTILFGRSGLGKTSLLGAGLLPRLKVEGREAVLARLRFDDAPPLVQQVREALGQALGVKLEARSLWELAHHEATRGRIELIRPVLIFDQFEEIFTLAQRRDGRERREEVAALMAELAGITESRPPPGVDLHSSEDPLAPGPYVSGESALRIVLALREDFLHELERWKKSLPSVMRNRMELTELDGINALQVVLGPGCKAESPVVNATVAHDIVCYVAKREPGTDLNDIEAVPPLLSLLCAELNEARIRSQQPQISADQVRHHSEDILQQFYLRSFAGMPASVRDVVENLLVDAEGRHREASSRNTVLGRMDAAGVTRAAEFLDRLIERRLLTSELRDGVQRIELTHDLLVPLAAQSREEGRLLAEQRQRAEEEAARAEHELVRARAAELKAVQARRAQLVTWAIVVAMAGLLAFAILSAYQAWVNATMESVARSKAQVAEAKADTLLAQAAQRAFGRAQEQLLAGNGQGWNAYLAESLGYGVLPGAALAGTMALQQAPGSALLARLPHAGSVQDAVFSPDGRRVLTAGLDGAARVWDVESGEAVMTFSQEYKLTLVRFSPDGNVAATAGSDQLVRLWNVQQGVATGSALSHDGRINAVEFSPDGSRLITASDDGTAQLWLVRDASRAGPPLRHAAAVKQARFSPDGTQVVTLGADRIAQVWDAQYSAAAGPALRHAAEVVAVDFSPDGRRLATAAGDQVQVWDMASGRAAGPPLQHGGMVSVVRFSPDGLRIASAGQDHAVRLWEAASASRLSEPLMHEGAVNALAFSDDGLRLLSASADGTARLWDAQTGEALAPPLRHAGAVYQARFSPDGTRLVTASADGAARIWDTRRGAATSLPLRHAQGVAQLDFSSDGRYFATATDGGEVQLWDAKKLVAVGRVLNHGGPLAVLRFDAGSSRLLGVGEDGSVRLWQVPTGDLWQLPEHPRGITSADFSADGKWLATAGSEGQVQQWALADGLARRRAWQLDGSVSWVRYSPSGDRLAVAGGDGGVSILDAPSGAVLARAGHESGAVHCVEFSPDGAWLASAGDDGMARLWRIGDGELEGVALHHGATVDLVRFSPDGTRLASVGRDDTVQLWDTATGQAAAPALRHEDHVLSARFDSEGSRLLTIAGRAARLWDVRSGALLGEPLRHDGVVTAAGFSTDDAHVATAGRDGVVRIWDAQRGKNTPVGPFNHAGTVSVAEFSPDGGRLVTAGWDGVALIWDTQSGKAVGVPLHHADWVMSAQFSADGNRLVTASKDGTAQLWNARTGEPEGRPLQHADAVYWAEFSPDGAFVVTASKDMSARIWSAAEQRQIGSPMVHGGWVYMAHFSPDGKRIATAGDDGVARIWDSDSGRPRVPPLRHRGPVYSARFSHNGRQLVTASGDFTARIWNVADGAALGDPLQHSDAVVSAEFSPNDVRVLTASWDDTAQVWGSMTGMLSYKLPHEGDVVAARFSADGSSIVTASKDGAARLWDAEDGTALGMPLRHDGPLASVSFSPDGLLVATGSWDRSARLWEKDQRDADSAARGIVRSLQVLGGQKVDEDGRISDRVHDLALRLRQEERNSVGQSVNDRILRWHLADRGSRSISPFLPLGVGNLVDREIEWALTLSPDDPAQAAAGRKMLQEAYALAPAHPYLLLALARFEAAAETRALWQRLSLRRIAAAPRYGLRAAEIFRAAGDRASTAAAVVVALGTEARERDDDFFRRLHDVQSWLRGAEK